VGDGDGKKWKLEEEEIGGEEGKVEKEEEKEEVWKKAEGEGRG
jgi:hypothetical protein